MIVERNVNLKLRQGSNAFSTYPGGSDPAKEVKEGLYDEEGSGELRLER